jgi:hypothetical protein
MKCVVVYGRVHTGDYLFMVMKNRSMFHFKGDMIITWLLVQMKHTELNGCMHTCNCHLLFSLWNQHYWGHRICFWYGIKRGVRLWNVDFGNWKMSCSVWLFAERIQQYGSEREIVGKSVQGTLFLSGANWMIQKMKRQAVLFLISLNKCSSLH